MSDADGTKLFEEVSRSFIGNFPFRAFGEGIFALFWPNGNYVVRKIRRNVVVYLICGHTILLLVTPSYIKEYSLSRGDHCSDGSDTHFLSVTLIS